MKKTSLFISLFSVASLTFAQQLVSITTLTSNYSTGVIQASLGGTWDLSNRDINPVKSYKVTYNTTDLEGNPTVASGAVYIPTLSNCEYAPILAYDHGTEFVKNNVPSTNNYRGQGLFFSTTGYITVMPDYLGMGVNSGIHPYQHSETEATATIDLIRAVRQYLDTAANQLKDNGQVFITGYSQGGHAAMATNKYIQDNQLEGEFNVIACAPLSGAYDQTGAQFDLIFDGDSNYYAPSFLPYVLGSYQAAYGNLYQNYTDIYDANKASQIETYLVNGTNTFAQWNSMLGTNYYGFMQDSVLQNILADIERDTHPINSALRANNLYDWIPNNPIKMLYCGSDSLVSPENSINTLDTMLALGATTVEGLNLSQTGDHNTCFVPTTDYTLTWFDSLATKCENYASVNSINVNKVTLYPNPSKRTITVEGIDLGDKNVEVYSTIGQLMEIDSTINNQLIIAGLPNGVYFLAIKTKQGELLTKLKFIKE